MVIMPVIVPTTPHIPREDQINMAAVQYSSDSTQQVAFKAGAHWADGPDLGCVAVLGAVLIVIVIATQSVAVFFGLMDGTSPYGEIVASKWKYIFFLRNPAFKFSRWMSKK